jgi:predicted XRE-type DNA-binding protein
MKTAANKPAHATYGNVLDDLGFSPEQATALKFKAELYQAILKYTQKYSQKELQAILGEPQPRVSELLNGKIANKSVDKLLHYAGRLGIEAKAKFAQTHKEVVVNELALIGAVQSRCFARRNSRTTTSTSWCSPSTA